LVLRADLRDNRQLPVPAGSSLLFYHDGHDDEHLYLYYVRQRGCMGRPHCSHPPVLPPVLCRRWHDPVVHLQLVRRPADPPPRRTEETIAPRAHERGPMTPPQPSNLRFSCLHQRRQLRQLPTCPAQRQARRQAYGSSPAKYVSFATKVAPPLPIRATGIPIISVGRYRKVLVCKKGTSVKLANVPSSIFILQR